MSKLLLLHIIALNRCLYSEYTQCSLGYLNVNYKASAKKAYCRAYGIMLTDMCPIMEYINIVKIHGYTIEFNTLLQWEECGNGKTKRLLY